MPISRPPSFNERLEKLLLYAIAGLACFSAWSVSEDRPMVETLQKGAIFACIIGLVCLRRNNGGMREFLVPFLPFVTISLVSAIYWANDVEEFKSFLTLYMPIIAGVAFLGLRGSVSSSMQQWRNILLFSVTLSIVGGTVAVFIGIRSGIRNPWGEANYQLQGLHGPAQLSLLCSFIVILYLARAGNMKRSDWFIALVCFVLILATGVRTILAALLAGTVVVMWLGRTHFKRNQLMFLSAILLLFSAMGIWRSLDRSLNIKDVHEAFVINTSRRSVLWPEYIELGMKHPWIGCGPDIVMNVMTTGETYSPHNTYIELFVLLGFPGMVSYFAGWGWVILQGLNRSRRQAPVYYRTIGSIGIILALCGVTDNILRAPFVMIVLSAIVAMGMSRSASFRKCTS